MTLVGTHQTRSGREGGRGDALPRRGPDSLAVKGRCGGTFRWTAPANLHPLPPRFRTAFPAFPSSRLEQSARHPASQRAAANGHSHDETRVSCPLPRRVCVVPVNARQRCIGLCNPFAFPDEDHLLAPSGFPRPPSPRVHDYAKGTQTGSSPRNGLLLQTNTQNKASIRRRGREGPRFWSVVLARGCRV